ncbi:MAG: helix-turn-helix domain-containing protein [Myxococcales bacterium]|nr:helix-turn-helix domain-containing protein [Myxococcales bacterium]
MPSNRVRELREARGLSQIVLAERSRLTRQSVGAIEAGRAIPAVDVALRIARALDCQVEELFGPSDEAPALDVELAAESATSRLALALVRERWVGLPLAGDGLRTAADALVVKARGRRASVTPLRPLGESRENLALMGCATGLGLLADRLHGKRGSGRYHWLPSSSGAALRALAGGYAHVAGVHSVAGGGETDPNVAAVRKSVVSEALVLVTLAGWEAGLLTRGDDERVRSVADVTARGVTLVVREKGAGARQLLEQRMRAAGLSLDLLRGQLVASGHLDVARAVAMGAADVGVATRDAALAFGLRFVPLAEERYDLVIPRSLISDARVERLLDVLVSQASRRELVSLGYDVSSAGNRVAEVSAA